MAKFIDRLRFLETLSDDMATIRQAVQNKLNTMLPSRIKSKANPFELLMNIVLDVTSILKNSIINAIRETNIFVAERTQSVRGLAQLTGHYGTRPISARGLVRMEQTRDGLSDEGTWFTIDQRTIFTNLSNGLQYTLQTQQPIRLDSGFTTKTFNIVEGVRKTQQIVADGNELFTVHLDDTAFIENYGVSVLVDSVPFERVDNTLELQSGNYELRNGFDNQVDLVFRGLTNGQVITVEYLTTNGTFGNAEIGTEFEISSGVFGIDGSEVDIASYVTLTAESGFTLGSDGESIETTRNMAGFSSRSLTFPKPDNLKAYLSRITTIASVDAWRSEDDTKVFNMVCFPRIVLRSLVDYFSLPLDKFTLSENTKAEIIKMIEASRRQMVSDEFVFHDVTVSKYALLIYVDGTIYDTRDFKQKVRELIAEHMVSETFGTSEANLVSRSSIVNILDDMDEVSRVNITILSNENETARIAGKYTKTEQKVVGANIKTVSIVVTLNGDNPNLGFSEIGDMVTQKNEVPIIRGGFETYSGFELNAEGVHIFVKTNNVWEEI